MRARVKLLQEKLLAKNEEYASLVVEKAAVDKKLKGATSKIRKLQKELAAVKKDK